MKDTIKLDTIFDGCGTYRCLGMNERVSMSVHALTFNMKNRFQTSSCKNRRQFFDDKTKLEHNLWHSLHVRCSVNGRTPTAQKTGADIASTAIFFLISEITEI